MAGYSATPLARKLGLKDGMRAWWPDMPASVRREIQAGGVTPIELSAAEFPIDAAHVFVTRHAELEAAIAQLRPRLAPAGFLWVSWPKKSSGIASEVTDVDVRAAALATDLVDVKVCAVDAVWSGLKLVIRRERRSRLAPPPGKA